VIPRIYLAGPEVFHPDSRRLAEAKIALCARYGLVGVFPADDGPHLSGDARAIYRANLARLASCQGVLANLSPFRGPHADPGTVYEVALALARGIPVAAYTGISGDLKSRIPEGTRPGVDADGLAIEDFGLPENLMPAVALAESGLPIVVASDGPWGLQGADAALRRLAARLHFG
jgi:nucleoside 2-deoxyribosyltransferase